MKIDRSQVEIVLADATVDPVSRWHVNDTFNRELVAELARAWLALDSAPEVLLNFDAIPGGNVVCTYDIDIHHELVGQRVRLVATPHHPRPR